ncbi:MAG: hypothetical protein ACQKBW_06495 [Puniceicoccales bacterium]
MVKRPAILSFFVPALSLLASGLYANPGPAAGQDSPPPQTAAQEQRLAPGETLTLAFPQLPPMKDGQLTTCEVRLPDTYAPDRDFPLLVWFGGGHGSATVGGAVKLVDPATFIIVALPYPEGRRPRVAVDEGTIDEFWDYLQPMLAAVQEKVPNISKSLRIAGGTSSGAHLVGSGICQRWPGFSDYFTAYILHEGGHAPGTDFTAAHGKPILVVYGEQSTAYPWQQRFNQRIRQSEARITYIDLPEAGHGLTEEGRQQIRAWTDRQEARLCPDLSASPSIDSHHPHKDPS